MIAHGGLLIDPLPEVRQDLSNRRAARWQQRRAPRPILDFAYGLKVPDTADPVTDELANNDPAIHAPQWFIMQAIMGELRTPDDAVYNDFTSCSDTQDGKSWLIQQVLFHTLIEQGQNAIYAMPTRDGWKSTLTTKIETAAEAAGLSRYWPDTGSGSRGGASFNPFKLRRIGDKGGGILMPMSAGGRNESGQASITSRLAIFDELDDWPRLAFRKAMRRLDRFMSEGLARVFKASTIKSRKDGSPSLILEEWERGCQLLVLYRCTHCGELTPFSWETFEYDVEIFKGTERVCPGSATVRCEHCNGLIDDTARQQMLYDYDYRLENPGASAFSIKWHGLNAPWKSLYWLATEDYQAKQAEARGDYATARTFTQDQKAEEYTDTAGFRNVDATQLALQSARADYQRGRIPDDCVMAVTAIDVQIDRVYSLTLAATQDLRMFIVDWHEDYFARRDEEPTDEMRHAVLTKVRQRHSDGWRYTTDEDGALLHGDLLGVDVRYETKSVGKWIAKATKVVPIMGEDADKKGTKADREYADGLIQVRERIHPTPNQPRRIWYVRTAHIREITRAAWFLADGDPGSLYLPAGVAEDDPLIRHLTAWRIVTDDEGVATRVPKGKRHDYNDCLCYAWAMLLHRMAQRQRNNGKGRVTGVVGKALA